jgi:hypothetical protein
MAATDHDDIKCCRFGHQPIPLPVSRETFDSLKLSLADAKL